MKPDESESDDQDKAEWWLKQAEEHFANREMGYDFNKRAVGFARIMKPVLAMIEWERAKKLSAKK